MVVISLSYGTQTTLVYFEFAGFRQQKYMAYNHFHWSSLYGKILTG